MKVIIAGGGTGGHIFPAISIAEEILKRNSGNKVLFVGTVKGLEAKLLSKKDYTLEFISSGGIKGKGFIESLKNIASALKGFFDSLKIIKRHKPDLVLGVGGYVSGPIVFAAALLSIPTAICEQNSVPGITNRILSRFVKRVFVSFEESGRFFSQKQTIVVGNPIRSNILINNEYSQEQNGFTILVFGGSQGSHKLNLLVPKAFGTLRRNDVFLIHQTGEEDLENVRKAYEWYGVRAEVFPFIEDIATVYMSANLVIARAGAGTIAEITALGKPAMLVPYPFSAYNHQLKNAKVLEKAGAAVVIEEKDAVPERLTDVLKDLLNKDKLKEMGKRAKFLGKPDAAQRIVDEIQRLIGVS
ncbi:MAG TPA: undecaprenyldiphospho-muramoylpentapeptide beta-N-acetylglucosaminyltransferase [Thermodesulfobacteriota bacterium]|jgi:UDP-N-acetylglucosamine--N-acetylmuramyl-(pentapeptide) pyrophosphoryl-undecaprenol N-acetylglucosamine transferase